MNAPYLRINFPTDSGRKLSKNEIVEAFADEIKKNTNCRGLRLPPVRMVAHQLDMSKTTIQEVYDELASRELVVNRSRVGLFIKETPKDVLAIKRPKAARASLPKLSYPDGFPGPVSEQLVPGKIMLSSAFLDPNFIPREQLENCFRSVLKRSGLAQEYQLSGYRPLREQIAVRLKRFGIIADPEHIIITVGSQQALAMVARALAKPVMAMESPGYLMGKRLFAMSRIKTAGLPLDPFKGIDLSLWESIIEKERPAAVHIVTSFQNPTGYSYTSAELAAILDWSQRFGFGIIEDDWGSEMLSNAEFRPSMRAIGGDAVFYVNSFTKKLLPSLRIGYVIGNKRSVQALIAAKRVSTLSGPLITEAALGEFLERGYYDVHIKKVQTALDRKYTQTLAALGELMPEEVRWNRPGGPFIWLELPSSIDIDELVKKAMARNVIISSSQEAFFDKPHLNGIKINYAYNPSEQTIDGLERLAWVIKSMLGKPNAAGKIN